MTMTFQPKKRQRAKVHGFRARMKTVGGRKVIAARRAKGRDVYKRQPLTPLLYRQGPMQSRTV